MIVEIHGIDCDELECALLKHTFRPVTTDDIIEVNSYRGGLNIRSSSYVLRRGRVRVILRKPGELCATIHGSARDIVAILHVLGISREPFLQFMKERRSSKKRAF